MKRTNLHSIIIYTVVAMLMFSSAATYAQHEKDNSYVFLSRTLSDFGDGHDQSLSLVWKAKFSESVAQVPGAKDNNAASTGDDAKNSDQVIIQGGNPDPERSVLRYYENKPDGITDVVAGPQKYVLGLKAQFSQQGYNWIELRPSLIGTADEVAKKQIQENVTADSGKSGVVSEVTEAPDLNAESHPYRIPFTGKGTDISLWVWGGYYGWWIEVYVRDYLGYQYRFPLGDLLYKGWKHKRTEIPDSVPQESKRLPAKDRLEFEMIKLWSFPSEHVDQFYVYFDLLQYGSKFATEIFNGKSLSEDGW